MRKKLAGFCSFLLFGTWGMFSGVAQEQFHESTLANPSEAFQILQRQEMSDEEKDRRRDVCARMFDYCHDWCMKTNKNPASKGDVSKTIAYPSWKNA